MTIKDRREFLKSLAAATGGVVVLPLAISCTGAGDGGADKAAAVTEPTDAGGELVSAAVVAVPIVRPDGWDPVAFNSVRGAAGAIPASYGDTGLFVAADGQDITANSGKNTVYLVKLPSDVAPGDEVRVYAHCLYHGEYVDFLGV